MEKPKSDAPQKIKIWITSYALSKGVIETQGYIVPGNSGKVMCEWPTATGRRREVPFWGKDWHDRLEDAVMRAEIMREQHIASAQKKLDKLRSMMINVVPAVFREEP